MQSRESPELGQLADVYEIIAEISGRAGARAFMGRRRADGAEVLITVAAQPDGDEGNALNHLAADANLLKGRRHRALIPVLDGVWVENSFAVVTERPDGSTLEELLARREEEFDYPRIAMILQELNGLLDWAREQKVIHRALGTDNIYLEPGSDRVLASFEVRALPIADMPGPEEDARTIAMLARAMLTRSTAAPERESQPLAELRPGLPESVLTTTEALLQRSGSEIPDVRGYIAAIAMADALKRGETECANTMAKLREEERAAREALQTEKEAAILAAEEQREEFARERAAILREKEEERTAFEREKERELAAVRRERETMLAALAKERQALLKVRDELEREREELSRRAEELQAQRGLYAPTEEFQTPVGLDALPAIPALPTIPEISRSRRGAASRSPRSRRALLFAAAAAVLLIVVTLAALTRRPSGPQLEQRASLSAAQDSAAGISVTRSSDSAGDVSVDSTATPGVPGIPADFVSGVATRAPTDPGPAPRPRPRPVAVPLRFDSTQALDSLGRRDTTVVRPPVTPALPGVDSLVRPRPDTLVRRDSLRRDTIPRRDTMPRRDTLVRRDTTRPGNPR